VLGTLSNQKRLDYRSLATPSKTCTNLRCTGQCPVLRLARPANWLLSGKTQRAAAKTQRAVWCAPDCPVSHLRPRQRSDARSAGDTWASPTVGRSHQNVRCATRVMATTVGFARKGRKSCTVHCPVVHRTVSCAHGQKATMTFQMKLQWLLAALGLQKGPIGA
jgi:hypothetical protein